jgi:DNA-binding transcriptional regulator/RsmH inhibitor MraZ
VIDNAALIIGVLEHIEVWNPQLYQEYERSQGESYEEVAHRVFTL